MSTNHTPGPWKAVSADASAEVGCMEIAEVAHMRVIPEAGGWPSPGTPWDDALLIAAAPELLEALREAVEREHNPFEPDNQSLYHQKWSALIAKATGGQP